MFTSPRFRLMLGMCASFAVSAKAKTLMDCSWFFASASSNSYFVPSDVLSWPDLAQYDADNYTYAISNCVGTITSATKLAVIKDPQVAKEFVAWMENWQIGAAESYVALQQFENATTAYENWYWADGTYMPANSTYWTSSGLTNESRCGILNAYSGGDSESHLSSVTCDSTKPYICEIPGK
jgi:hypothetical protein